MAHHPTPQQFQSILRNVHGEVMPHAMNQRGSDPLTHYILRTFETRFPDVFEFLRVVFVDASLEKPLANALHTVYAGRTQGYFITGGLSFPWEVQIKRQLDAFRSQYVGMNVQALEQPGREFATDLWEGKVEQVLERHIQDWQGTQLHQDTAQPLQRGGRVQRL